MNNTEITLSFPVYDKKIGVLGNWIKDSKVSVTIDSEEKICLVSGNRNGLLSLAQYLVSLAQDGAPVGSHLHFDDFSYLEVGSNEIIFEKTD